jgi:hypothetical protein
VFRIVRDFFHTLSQPCRGQTALLSRELDAPLSAGESLGVRAHLLYCRACRRFRKQIRLLRDLAGTLGSRTEAPAGLPLDVRERVLGRVGGNSENR